MRTARHGKAPDPQDLGQRVAAAGQILHLIGSGRATSRAALVQVAGLSRATVTERLTSLFAVDLVREAEETIPSGGRPTRSLRLNGGAGLVLAAEIGESHTRVALTDLQPRIIAERVGKVDVACGPIPIATWISEQLQELLREAGHARPVLGLGLSLPAPVDFVAGRVVGPSIMTGWDDFDVVGWFGRRFGVPVIADNDVNILTLAECRHDPAGADQLLFIKAGSGIGSGIVIDGKLHRGAQGAAGDIGHIQLGAEPYPLCRCGKLGCVEARAAGWALARELRALGFEATDARDVLALVRRNQPEAVRLLRDAGRVLGEVAADCVAILNPRRIILGGTLAQAGEHLLAGMLELVYQRSLPLATRELQIQTSRLGERAGIIGIAWLVIGSQLAPDVIAGTIQRLARMPIG